MDTIHIKVKKHNESVFSDSLCHGVLNTIRNLDIGDYILFPMDYKEAVGTAKWLLRKKESKNISAHIVSYEGCKYMMVGNHKWKEGIATSKVSILGTEYISVQSLVGWLREEIQCLNPNDDAQRQQIIALQKVLDNIDKL